MATIIRMVERQPSSTSKSKPTIITWGKWEGKPVKMVRGHSINRCVHEILEFNKRRNFLKINVIGQSGTGKTSLMFLLSHLLHSANDKLTINDEHYERYEVKFFKDEQLVNFKATVEGLSNNNVILCFDDLSGLVENHGKEALNRLIAELTTVRHINDLESRKIIVILSFHSQKLLHKQLRISNFSFYTDCELEEIDYLVDLLGKENTQKIKFFQRLKAQAGITHKFTYQLGGRGNSFSYKDGEPFQSLLYSNGIHTIDVVFPLVSWVLGDKICQTCNPAIESQQTKINLEEFEKDYTKKFTKAIAKRAVELKLYELGKSTQPKRVQQAKKYIELFLSRKQINIDELAEAFNLKETRTNNRLEKQPEFLKNEKIKSKMEVTS